MEEGTMAGGWRMLVLVVGLAALACVAHSRFNYEETVNQALEIFNHGQRGQPLFRLVQTLPAPGLNTDDYLDFSFQVNETVCPSNQQREPENCAFLDEGEERQCSGFFTVLSQGTRIMDITCELNQQEEENVTIWEESWVRRSAEEPTSSMYEKAKEMYERAKYEIIGNILRNF